MKQLKEDHGVGVVVDLVVRKGESGEAQKADLKYVGKKLPMVPTPIMLESLSRTIDQEIGVPRALAVAGFAGCLALAFTLAPQNVAIGLAILTAGIIFRSARLRVAKQREHN